MALFRRRRSATASSGNALDDLTLAHLAARSDLSRPRHWVHYVYCADKTAASKAAKLIAADGWGLQRVDQAASGSGWVVIAERHDVVVSPQAMTAARSFFEGVAGQVDGGDYDGWEASED